MGSDLNMWFWNRVRFAELAGTRAVPLLLPLPAKGVCVVPEGVRMRRAWEHPCGSHCPGAVEGSDAGLPVCVQKRGAGYTSAVVRDQCICPDAPLRAQGRQQEFQLQSGF